VERETALAKEDPAPYCEWILRGILDREGPVPAPATAGEGGKVLIHDSCQHGSEWRMSPIRTVEEAEP
jgi:hypothetical protein